MVRQINGHAIDVMRIRKRLNLISFFISWNRWRILQILVGINLLIQECDVDFVRDLEILLLITANVLQAILWVVQAWIHSVSLHHKRPGSLILVRLSKSLWQHVIAREGPQVLFIIPTPVCLKIIDSNWSLLFSPQFSCLMMRRSIHNIYAWWSLRSVFYWRTTDHILRSEAITARSYSSRLVVNFLCDPRRVISSFWVWCQGSMWGLCHWFEGFILEHLIDFLSILPVGDSSLHEQSTGVCLCLWWLLLATEDHEVALAADMKIQLVPMRSTIFLSLRLHRLKIAYLWFRSL